MNCTYKDIEAEVETNDFWTINAEGKLDDWHHEGSHFKETEWYFCNNCETEITGKDEMLNHIGVQS